MPVDPTKVLAIDVHVHAEVSCHDPEDPVMAKYFDAASAYFNRLRKKGWQSRPLASLSPFSSPRRQSFWEVTFQNPVVFDRPRAL